MVMEEEYLAESIILDQNETCTLNGNTENRIDSNSAFTPAQLNQLAQILQMQNYVNG